MKYLLLASALISVSVCAKSPDFYDNDVVWLSAYIGKTESSNEQVKPDDSVNFQAKLGYDFNRYVALYSGGGIASDIGNNSVSYAQAGIKLTYPLTSNWSVFSTIGGASALSSGLSHQPKFNAEVGMSYLITPQFSTQLSIEHKNNLPITELHDSDLTTVQWGLTYHFGRPDTSSKVIQQIELIK